MESGFGPGLIGHETIIQLLDAWLPHPAPAYLLIGPPHLGKHTVAERFVPRLLGLAADDPHWMTHPDLVVLQPEEGKVLVSVEQVRNARERLALRPSVASRVVAYLPYADRLNESGTNALLKVIEEPPAGAVFVLVAEDASRIPATLKSRSVVLPFASVSRQQLEAGLIARGMSKNEVERLASSSHGKPGRALAPDEAGQPGREFVAQFLQATSAGKRLTVVETLVKTCESQEDAQSAWRDALQSASEAVGEHLASESLIASALGIAILTSLRSVGSAVPPRLPLEVCAVRVSANPELVRSLFPSHLPNALPLIYTA